MKARYINLTTSEREALEQGYKAGKQNTFRSRCQIILLSDQNYSIAEIAEIQKITRQRVARWLTRFETGGIDSLHTSKGQGRPPIVRIDNKKVIDKIEVIVEQYPQKLDQALLKIKEVTGKKMSRKTLSRILKKRWAWKRFRRQPAKRPLAHEVAEAKKALQGLLALAILKDIDLRFADESSFNLEPNVPYGWIRIGEQHGLRSSKGGKLNVFGLLNYSGDLTSYTTTGKVDSLQIIEWINNFAQTITKKTVIVLDNAPWHRSKLVQQTIEDWKSQGLEIFYLPPYSPHLNIIETLWRKMKHEWLRPEDFNDAEALHNRIDEILEKYGSGLFDINFKVELLLQ